MLKGYNGFRAYVDYREAATINPQQATGSPNDIMDKQIIANQLLKPATDYNPQETSAVLRIVADIKRRKPTIPLATAVAAAEMQRKMQRQQPPTNSRVGI